MPKTLNDIIAEKVQEYNEILVPYKMGPVTNDPFEKFLRAAIKDAVRETIEATRPKDGEGRIISGSKGPLMDMGFGMAWKVCLEDLDRRAKEWMGE